jgi:putative FmdB family regulatory protein
MPTYLYECPVHGEFEHQHSINDALEVCPLCQAENSELQDGEKREPQKVKRLIAGGSGFILNGSGWAKDNYS